MDNQHEYHQNEHSEKEKVSFAGRHKQRLLDAVGLLQKAQLQVKNNEHKRIKLNPDQLKQLDSVWEFIKLLLEYNLISGVLTKEDIVTLQNFSQPIKRNFKGERGIFFLTADKLFIIYNKIYNRIIELERKYGP